MTRAGYPDPQTDDEFTYGRSEAPLPRRDVITIEDLCVPAEGEYRVEETPCHGGITGYAAMKGDTCLDVRYSEAEARGVIVRHKARDMGTGF